MKPLFHLLHGSLGVRQGLALIVTSLPLLAILALIVYLIDWGLKQLMPYSIWQIVSEQQTFQQFLYDAGPYLYGLLVAFVISTLADKLVEGSGKWAVRIRKLIKSPMALITGIIVRGILPFIIAIPVKLYLVTIDSFFVNRIGKPK